MSTPHAPPSPYTTLFRSAGTPPAAANIVGWCAKEPKGANDDQSSRRQRDRGRPLPHSSSDGLSSTAWQRSEAWRGHRSRTGPPNAQWSALAAVAVGPVVRPVGGTFNAMESLGA